MNRRQMLGVAGPTLVGAFLGHEATAGPLTVLPSDKTLSHRLKQLQEMTHIACADGTWNYDPYFHGMANGVIGSLAVMTDFGDPKYLDAPDRWLSDPKEGSLEHFAESSVLPQKISPTGAKREPLTEVLICDSISGGADSPNGMPRSLTLVRRTNDPDCPEQRMEYTQSGPGPGGHVFVDGSCECGQRMTDDPVRCPLDEKQ